MRIRIVDAFTDRPFAGNPAGVLLLDAFPDDDRLQNDRPGGQPRRDGFRPPAAGGRRGRLGAALVHARHRGRHVRPRDARHGPRPAHHRRPRGHGALRHPQRCPRRDARARTAPSPWTSRPHRSRRSRSLPGSPRRWAPSRVAAFDTGPNIGDLLVELADEKTVRALAPDHKALAAHSERGIIATARAEDPSRGYDFVSRCFFPNVGIDEDPVTGSAHTALAPLWSERLGPPRPHRPAGLAPLRLRPHRAARRPHAAERTRGHRHRGRALATDARGSAARTPPPPRAHAVGSQPTLPASSA